MVGEAERLEVEEGSDRRAPLGGVCVKERDQEGRGGGDLGRGELGRVGCARERKGEGKNEGLCWAGKERGRESNVFFFTKAKGLFEIKTFQI